MKSSKLNKLWVVGLFAAVGLNMGVNQSQEYGQTAQASLKLTTGSTTTSAGSTVSESLLESIEACIPDTIIGKKSYICHSKAPGKSGKGKENITFSVDVNPNTKIAAQEETKDVTGKIVREKSDATETTVVNVNGKCDTSDIEELEELADSESELCLSCLLGEVKVTGKLTLGVDFTDIAEIETAVANSGNQLGKACSKVKEKYKKDVAAEKKRIREEARKQRIIDAMHKQCLMTEYGDKIETEEDKAICVEDMLSQLEGTELARFVDRQVFPSLLYTAVAGGSIWESPYMQALENNSDNFYIKGSLMNIQAFDKNNRRKKYETQKISQQARMYFPNNPAMAQQIIETETQKINQSLTQGLLMATEKGHPAFRNQMQNIERAHSMTLNGGSNGSSQDYSFNMFDSSFMNDIGANSWRVDDDSFFKSSFPSSNSFNPSNSKLNNFDRSGASRSSVLSGNRRGRGHS